MSPDRGPFLGLAFIVAVLIVFGYLFVRLWEWVTVGLGAALGS